MYIQECINHAENGHKITKYCATYNISNVLTRKMI